MLKHKKFSQQLKQGNLGDKEIQKNPKNSDYCFYNNTKSIIKKQISLLIIAFFLTGCAAQKSIVVQSKEDVKTILRDSLIIRDSVVITPIERIVDIVPQYDTLHLQTSLAKSKAWVDTTTHTLKGEIQNKEQKQNRDRTEIKYIHRTDSVVIEKPVPYPEPVPYVPKVYKWSLGFSIIVLLAVFGTIIWKLKRWFI